MERMSRERLRFTNLIANNCSIRSSYDTCILEMNKCSDCDCDQARSIGASCEKLTSLMAYYMQFSDAYLSVLFMFVGAVANVFLLITLRQQSFIGPVVLRYIRIIAAHILLLISVQLVQKVTNIAGKSYRNTYQLIVFNRVCQQLCDCIQVFISTFTVFLNLDRLIGIAAPISYPRLGGDRKSITLAYIVSIMTSFLGMLSFLGFISVYPSTGSRISNSSSTTIDDDRINKFCILTLRIVELILLIGFLVGVEIQYRRRRRLAAVITDDSYRTEVKCWSKFYLFHVLQTIPVIVQLFFVCLADLSILISNEELMAVRTYRQSLAGRSIVVFSFAAEILRQTTLQICASVMFFCCLFLSRQFRKVLLKLIQGSFGVGNRVFATVWDSSIARSGQYQ